MADQLTGVKQGELIAIELSNQTACLGEYEGLQLQSNGFKIELEKYASIDLAPDKIKYRLQRGEFVRHPLPALSTVLSGARSYDRFYVPGTFFSARILKGPDVDGLLQRYGFSMEDYHKIWPQTSV